MKIFYLINSRIPTEKAEGLEAMKLCEALADLAKLEFIAPRRFNKIKQDPFVFYGAKNNFKIKKLPVIDFMPIVSGRIVFWLEAISFSLAAFFYLLFNSNKNDIIFSHDQISLQLVSLIRRNVFYDMHDFPRSRFWLYRSLFKRLRGITTTNNWKREQLIKKFNLEENKILAWPNGVELEKFNINISKEEARKKLNLPTDKILIGYVGMLKTMGMEKGIDTAIEAMKLLSESARLVLVGGRQEDVEYYKNFTDKLGLRERVLFIGWAEHRAIPLYLKAFDLVIAPFPKSDHYNYYMSPMKIFEYMASGRPIVASDLNSIREIINDESAALVKPDSAQALAEGVNLVLNDKRLAEKISARAYEKVKNFSWQSRAQAIINFIKS